MGLIKHKHIENEGEIGIWKITEPEAWFMKKLLLYPAELRQLSEIKGRRRQEWLAARQLIHQMSKRKKRGAFVKDEHGKPHLEHSDWHISISHSHGLAAAIASPYLCGIDIQFIVPKITRLAHKFLRPEEADSITSTNELDQLHFYWGAKEALYKAYGRKKLKFINHIHIQPFEYNTPKGQTTGRVIKEGECIDFNVFYQRSEDGYMLVWATRTQDTL